MKREDSKLPAVRSIAWLDGWRRFISRLPNQIFLHDRAKQKIRDHQAQGDARQYADVSHRRGRGKMRAQIGAGEEYVAHHSRVQDEEHQPTRDVMQLKRQFHGRCVTI